MVENNLNLIISIKENYKIEFLNHGYCIHTEFVEKNNNYVSTFSYQNEKIESIKQDILKAHHVFKEKLNIDLKGFRAPHFGEISFDKKKKIFEYLNSLGYEYSSSSIYDLAFSKVLFLI